MIVNGNVIKFGDNINTDIISPPQFMELSIEDAAPFAMQAVRTDFAQAMKTKKIIVAGNNFGSGSSRETAPLTLKYLGAEAIVAKFFARIFFRNAINIGLPVIECEHADKIEENDEIEIDLENGLIKNFTKDEEYECSRLPKHLLELITGGGLVEYLKRIAR